MKINRRNFLKAAAIASTAGVAGIAGYFFLAEKPSTTTSTTTRTQTTITDQFSPSQFLSRVVTARVYQQQNFMTNGGVWTQEGIQAIISALQGFNPTYVWGFIRLKQGTTITTQMASDWAAAKAAMPNAVFDLKLNAQDYASLDTL